MPIDNSKSPLSLKPDYLICTCMAVMYSEICQAIERGCHDMPSLSQELLIGTGCSSCLAEVEALLKEYGF